MVISSCERGGFNRQESRREHKARTIIVVYRVSAANGKQNFPKKLKIVVTTRDGLLRIIV